MVTGGAIGDELLTLMRHEGLDVMGFTIDGTTRESVAITGTNTARQYRLSVRGPTVDRPGELQHILQEISSSSSIVVFSVSVPRGLPSDFYRVCWGIWKRTSPRPSTLRATRWPPSSRVPLGARRW